ncbi:protein of unknown function (DUF3531) [Rubidibacter lacunae KORDI 51-2]|uniref:DUF3531 domain-containing protein n=1 Tax=Rubidibacter lacunae KORDI 51-2 TaxID=582515 RepID=U5DM47_9CHRO|nr:DUF3531 family protein [Rubidibacter lacunae]ERN40790.1 protein of unknown function (DUF3531) [Rubidibacter lacunae KORDI 51-2]
MKVTFREVNPFDLWIWLEFATVPSIVERQYVEELFDSWFYVGKLGGFNAENFQVMEAGVDLSYMDYDTDQSEQALMAPMHNSSEFEYRGTWGRCWFDLGTSDPVALDVLINALMQLGRDYLQIEQAIVGGVNEDWPVESKAEARFYDDNENIQN